MTARDEFCAWLLDSGWVEYPVTVEQRPYKRAFEYLSQSLTGPKCQTNDRTPRLHLEACDLARLGEKEDFGFVEVVFFGGRVDGVWLNNRIYAIPVHDFEARLPGLIVTASAIWQSFCKVPGDLEILSNNTRNNT